MLGEGRMARRWGNKMCSLGINLFSFLFFFLLCYFTHSGLHSGIGIDPGTRPEASFIIAFIMFGV